MKKGVYKKKKKKKKSETDFLLGIQLTFNQRNKELVVKTCKILLLSHASDFY